MLARTGGDPVYELLQERMPALPPEVVTERLSVMTMVILRSVADRARFQERGPAGHAEPRPGSRRGDGSCLRGLRAEPGGDGRRGRVGARPGGGARRLAGVRLPVTYSR